MGKRLRLMVVIIGAALVVATFTYPQWRTPPVATVDDEPFPELQAELQDDFLRLPASEQRLYLAMRSQNILMATDLVSARLSPPDGLPPEAQTPPDVSTAEIVAQGEFARVELADDDEREIPPFNDLYRAAGQVTVYQFPDQRKILWIENLSVLNGPSLNVLLSASPTPLMSADLGVDFIDLGPLQATSGNHAYEIPTELNINNYRSVVIYESRYGIIFGVARLF